MHNQGRSSEDSSDFLSISLGELIIVATVEKYKNSMKISYLFRTEGSTSKFISRVAKLIIITATAIAKMAAYAKLEDTKVYRLYNASYSVFN